MRAFRFFRGLLSTSVLWAGAWCVAGSLLWLVLPPEAGTSLTRRLVGGAQFWAFTGAIAGGAFSVILGFAERQRAIADLGTSRIALWGVAGGVALPVIILAVEFMVSVTTPAGMLAFIAACVGLGWASASVTLAMARRSDTTLLPDSAEHPELPA